jgi:pimeloyl-ACP methyl ester carboxylesterase
MTGWVFLRGLTREAGHWGGFADAWRRRFAEGPLVCLDLPGNGVFRAQRSPLDVRDMVSACRRALQDSGAAPPYRVLGLSLGGMVAVDWAASHPHELLGAVLVNTSLRGFGPWHRRLRARHYGRMAAMLLVSDPLFRERAVLRMTSHRREPGAAPLLERWVAIREAHPVGSANAIRQLVAAARFRAPATPPKVPLLVLASRADELVDSRCSTALAKAWNADLALHPTAGHDLPLDDPQWVIEAVAHWLERMPAPVGMTSQ